MGPSLRIRLTSIFKLLLAIAVVPTALPALAERGAAGDIDASNYVASGSSQIEMADADQLMLQEVRQILSENPDHPGIGSKSSPLTMLVFQDLKCGMCGHFFKNALPQLKSEYVDRGVLRVEFVEYPLIEAEDEIGLALAALCASDQNHYYEYLRHLYQNIKTTNAADAVRYATELGLDQGKFKQCISQRRFSQQLQKNQATARTLGVNGTPTAFLNGMRLVGSKPFDAYRIEIEKLLKAVKSEGVKG